MLRGAPANEVRTNVGERMQEPSDSSEHLDDPGRRGRWHRVAADGIMVSTMLSVFWLAWSQSTALFSLHASPQRQLAFGAVSYAFAIGGALLLGVVDKHAVGLVWDLLNALLLSFCVPAMMGGWCIALALDELAGSRVDFGVAVVSGTLLSGIVILVTYRVSSRRPRVIG